MNIELMDDMHLSSKDYFLSYYDNMNANNISAAVSILENNKSLSNQLIYAQNVNLLIDAVNERELEPKRDIDYFLENLRLYFEDMINNTKVINEWDSQTQYYSHNFVYYQNKSYFVFTRANPPIGTLPTDTSYWIEYDIKGEKGYGGFKNLNFLRNWDNTISYKVQDVVVYQNKLWMAVANNKNYAPNLNHYPWALISLPDTPNKTPIQSSRPVGYNIGDFWFKVTKGSDVISIAWETSTPEPTPRFASASFVINNNIYIVGGHNASISPTSSNEAYDTITKTWSKKADYPISTNGMFGFSIGAKGYCAGGLSANTFPIADVYSYDSNSNSWSKITSLPEPLTSVNSSISIGNNGYCIGGNNQTGDVNNKIYKFDSTSETWVNVTEVPVPTTAAAVESVGNKIYIIGGSDVAGNVFDNVQIYDTSTNTWSVGATMLSPRNYAGSFTNRSSIYVVGGLDSLQYSTNTNEVYNAEENTWRTDSPMVYERNSLCGETVGSKGYAIGGINLSRVTVNGYVEEFAFENEDSSFEMIIDTSLGTNIISIPMTQEGSYNYWVDWGDGFSSVKITSYDDTNATHTYSAAGEYTIKIMGDLDVLKFTGNISQCLKEVTKCILSFTNIEAMFENCSNLVSIPDGIFKSSLSVISADSVFKNCSSLKIIPVGLFDNNSNIDSFNSTFENSGITSIPVGLFAGTNLVSTFIDTFKNCESLSSLPTGLFSRNNRVVSFSGTFLNCKKIETIPDNFLVNNPLVRTYESMFYKTGLTELPNDLFGTASSTATTFLGMFFGTHITSIPEGIFKYASNAQNYMGCFSGASLQSIPKDCFNGQNAIWNNAFDVSTIKTFGDNSLNGLQISSDLLKDQKNVEVLGENVFWKNNIEHTNQSVSELLTGCSNLRSVGNINLKGINPPASLINMFSGCTSLTNIGGFIYQNGEPSLACDISFEDCPLTHASLLNIKNSLVLNSPDNIRTLYLGSSNLNLLTKSEKMEIINLYWNLDGYDASTDIDEDISRNLVQDLKGDNNTEAESYLSTNLYYYVKLKNKSNPSKVEGLYAVDKKTAIVYDYRVVPTYEYIVSGYTESNKKTTTYFTKDDEGDKNGEIFKTGLNTLLNDNPNITSIVIGDSGGATLRIKNSGFEQLDNAAQLFKDKTTLKSITINGKFAPSEMKSMFETCTNLQNINFENFNGEKVTDMSRLFYGCAQLDTMVDIDMSNVVNASEMYRNSGVRTILENVLGNKIENASGMFRGCTNLNDFPATYRVFGENENLTDVSYMFEGCKNLFTVGFHNVMGLSPDGIWVIDQLGIDQQIFARCHNIINMSYLFANCTNLGSSSNEEEKGIPMAIFWACPKLENISHVFDGCHQIDIDKTLGANINRVLFVKNPELRDVSYAFAHVLTTSITEDTSSIHTTLFPVQTKIEDASYLFYDCICTDGWGNTPLPFIYKSKVLKNVEGMFKDNYSIDNLPTADENSTDPYNWGHLDTICPALENCSKMFDNCISLREQEEGSALTLIKVLSKIPALTNHSEMFHDDVFMGSYKNIPEGWK